MAAGSHQSDVDAISVGREKWRLGGQSAWDAAGVRDDGDIVVGAFVALHAQQEIEHNVRAKNHVRTCNIHFAIENSTHIKLVVSVKRVTYRTSK